MSPIHQIAGRTRTGLTLTAILLLGFPVQAQQSATPPADATQAAPAATPVAAEHPKKQKNQKDSKGKKDKKSSAPTTGAPTALCGDGTYSHDKPTEDGKGGKAKVCASHGGVSHFF